jgi:hypothetical protein
MPTTPPQPAQVELTEGSQEGLFSGIVDSFKRGLAGGSGKEIGAGLLEQTYKQGSELLTRQQNLIGVLGGGEQNVQFKNLLHGVNQVSEEFWGMQAASGGALHSIFADQQELISEYTGILSTNLLKIHMTKQEVTADDMADLTLLGRALDFSGTQMSSFLERQFALTGEANDDLLKQTLAYANAIEKSTGVSSKIIAGNVADMMSDVSTFGNMTVEEMSLAAAAIAQVGLEVSDVAGLVKKFSTFEGAADSVSKLTQVFGVQMDTMKYMTASYESPEEMLSMLQEDFERAGVDMGNMDMAQKRLLAQTVGMDISSIESLFGNAGKSLSQYTEQAQSGASGVDAYAVDNALSQADSDIQKINHMYGSIDEAARRTGQRSANAITSIFSTSIAQIGTEAQNLVNNGNALFGRTVIETKEEVFEELNVGELQGVLTNSMDVNADVLGESGTLGDLFRERSAGVSTPADQSAVTSDIIPEAQNAKITVMMDNAAATEGPITNNLAVPTVDTEAARMAAASAYVAELQTASGNKMDDEEGRQFAQHIANAMAEANRNGSTQPIEITLVDTQAGFEARLSGSTQHVLTANTQS